MLGLVARVGSLAPRSLAQPSGPSPSAIHARVATAATALHACRTASYPPDARGVRATSEGPMHVHLLVSGRTGRIRPIHLYGPHHWGVAECVERVLTGLPAFHAWTEQTDDWEPPNAALACVTLAAGRVQPGCPEGR